MRTIVKASIVGAAIVLALAAGPAASAASATWSFSCTGPAGTPSTFTATHELSSGSAFRFTEGTTVFVVMVWEDLTAGKRFEPPGASKSGIVTATCTTMNPYNQHTLRLGGRFVA